MLHLHGEQRWYLIDFNDSLALYLKIYKRYRFISSDFPGDLSDVWSLLCFRRFFKISLDTFLFSFPRTNSRKMFFYSKNQRSHAWQTLGISSLMINLAIAVIDHIFISLHVLLSSHAQHSKLSVSDVIVSPFYVSCLQGLLNIRGEFLLNSIKLPDFIYYIGIIRVYRYRVHDLPLIWFAGCGIFPSGMSGNKTNVLQICYNSIRNLDNFLWMGKWIQYFNLHRGVGIKSLKYLAGI